MGKNIRKIQSMLAGEFNKSSQVGYTPERVDRKVGDTWEDSEGIKWEQRKGYKIKISGLPGVGVLGDQCKDCKKGILKKGVHRDTYNRMGRCYHCQINFEVNLKSKRIGQNGTKWDFWVKLQQLMRWADIDKEAEDIINEMSEQIDPFDKSVANALANENRKQFKKDAGG
jgi:hypothetical protein